MGLEVLELLVQRRMRFVLPVLRWRWRVGQRFWYLPFSRNLYSDWFGYKLSQTELEQFVTTQAHGYWNPAPQAVGTRVSGGCVLPKRIASDNR
jgi:hypothetical protein